MSKKIYYYEEFLKRRKLKDTDESMYIYMTYLSKQIYPIQKLLTYICRTDRTLEREDLVNEGYINSIEKKKRFNSRDFENFLSNYLRYVNRQKRKGNTVLLNEDLIEEDTSYNIIDKVYLEELISTLPEEEKTLIKLYFYDCLTFEEIADRTHFKSKSGVKQKIDSILKKLQK